MLGRFLLVIGCSYGAAYATTVTLYNHTATIIDVSIQSYAKLASFRELLCYATELKPGQSAACPLPANRCVGAIYVHESGNTKKVASYSLSPADNDICRDMSFVIEEQGGEFIITPQ